jgi:exopolyphosphatase/guanosine-5'-triphosphate,3'-diphosphate pyrophosphatase
VKSDPTSPKRVASIDIGTNTILLLVAQVEGERLTSLLEKETIVRLGEGVQKNGLLLDAAIARGLETLGHYLTDCQAMAVNRIFAVGTNVLREAKNAGDFLKKAEEKFNLSIEIISGEEEAQLSYLAVAKDLGDQEKTILVMDVGGGSTEFVLGKGERISYWKSLPMGSVRFTEQFLHSDPVRKDEWEEMEKEIRKSFRNLPSPPKPSLMTAVGGTATALASVEQGLDQFVYEKIHHFVLKREALKSQLDLYHSKSIAERKKIPGLSPARADVILAGGTILYLAMTEFEYPSVLISCHGVRYGLIYKKISDCRLRIAD